MVTDAPQPTHTSRRSPSVMRVASHRGGPLWATVRAAGPSRLMRRPPRDCACAPGCNGRREGEHPADPPQPTESELPQQPHGLQPAEDLFDPFALLLTDRVSRVSRGAAIDRTAPVRRVLGHMRRDVQPPQMLRRTRACHSSCRPPASSAVGRDALPTIASAASRSAVPVAGSRRVSTTKPWRFSISTCPRKHSLASWPGALLTAGRRDRSSRRASHWCGSRHGSPRWDCPDHPAAAGRGVHFGLKLF